MRPKILTKALATAAANNICLSQTPGGAGNLTLNGSLVSGGVATLDTQRVVGIACAGNETARTFVVYGTNNSGAAISESVAGVNASTASTVFSYATVTRISVDAATAGAITVGTTGVGASEPVILDSKTAPFEVYAGGEITGTVNYTIQYTVDDILSIATLTNPALVTWQATSVSGATANANANLVSPVMAIRLLINSGTGTVQFLVRQSGRGG